MPVYAGGPYSRRAPTPTQLVLHDYPRFSSFPPPYPHPAYPPQLPLPALAQPALAVSTTPPESGLPRCALAGSLDPTTGIFYRTPEHPRLRTAQACEKCRIRKAKCSGDHPTCQRCHIRGLVCVYAPEGRIRGPNKPKIKKNINSETSSLASSSSPKSTPPTSLASDDDSEHEDSIVETTSKSANVKGKAKASLSSSRGRHTRSQDASPTQVSFRVITADAAGQDDTPPVRRGPGRPRKSRTARTASTETTRASRQNNRSITQDRNMDIEEDIPHLHDHERAGTAAKMDVDQQSVLSPALDMDTTPANDNSPSALVFLDPMTTPRVPLDRQPTASMASQNITSIAPAQMNMSNTVPFPTMFRYQDTRAISGPTVMTDLPFVRNNNSTPSTPTSLSTSPITTRESSIGPPPTPEDLVHTFPTELVYPPFSSMLSSPTNALFSSSSSSVTTSSDSPSSICASPSSLPTSSLSLPHLVMRNDDEGYDAFHGALGFGYGHGYGHGHTEGYSNAPFGCHLGEYNSGFPSTTTTMTTTITRSMPQTSPLGVDVGLGAPGVGVGVGQGLGLDLDLDVDLDLDLDFGLEDVHGRGVGVDALEGQGHAHSVTMSPFVEWRDAQTRKETVSSSSGDDGRAVSLKDNTADETVHHPPSDVDTML